MLNYTRAATAASGERRVYLLVVVFEPPSMLSHFWSQPGPREQQDTRPCLQVAPRSLGQKTNQGWVLLMTFFMARRAKWASHRHHGNTGWGEKGNHEVPQQKHQTPIICSSLVPKSQQGLLFLPCAWPLLLLPQ